MTSDNISSMIKKSIEKRLINIKNRSNQFHVIPPIIGIVMSDQFGNTIFVSEYESNSRENYNSIKQYLSDDDANLIEIDLVSMYFSSFKMFASQTNIKNLSHLEIHGSNIKVQIYFKFDDFIVIVFLNSNTNFDSEERDILINYFEEMILKHGETLKNYNSKDSKEAIHILAKNGTSFLKNVNRKYLKKHNKTYLKNYEQVERLTERIIPIVHNEICDYLRNIEENILFNLKREIKNKIQDTIFNTLLNSDE
ncbi:MAG: hypothetical protein BAJALOKI3v1_530026 [Promethearchaeota archaeon]|nr:MAG: hypothetical protein BAJALOKI3v1_530026 [Candidatus Lokiarchaeota archaeon]